MRRTRSRILFDGARSAPGAHRSGVQVAGRPIRSLPILKRRSGAPLRRGAIVRVPTLAGRRSVRARPIPRGQAAYQLRPRAARPTTAGSHPGDWRENKLQRAANGSESSEDRAAPAIREATRQRPAGVDRSMIRRVETESISPAEPRRIQNADPPDRGSRAPEGVRPGHHRRPGPGQVSRVDDFR